ncbi:MFS transporter [Chloroflexota bacterium]
MGFRKIFQPRPTLSEQEVKTGLRWLTWEGTVSMGFNSITTSGILVAFALAIGASNFHIGILAAIPFIMQLFQIPSILFVEKLRRRKAIAVLSWLPAQLLWIPIALIPVFLSVPGSTAISLLLVLMAARGFLSAIVNSAWNGWIRDLVPQSILGRFFSRRMAFATFAGVVFSLGAAFFIDYWRTQVPGENTVFGYTYVLLFGALFLGLASPIFMSLMPEPLMQPITGPQPSLGQRLTAPFRDTNFRRLLQFLFYWGFASNLAIPFFAVHMLQRLGLPISWVIALSILSQMFNILFLRVWGTFADRFGNKSVLSVGVSLYLLVIIGWIFTTMPERYFLTIPLLVILHIFAGIASAAVTFTVGTIGLKLAPQGEATSYLAGASLATNLGAGLGPLAGGLLADFFNVRQLHLTFTWIDPASTIQLPAMSIIGRDFLFGIAFVLGLITLGMLALIKEEGEVGREVILDSLMSQMREFSRPMSSVPGFTFLSTFPFGFLKRVPVPGLDVALGVTVYEIAEMAKLATSATIQGRNVTRRLTRALENGLTTILKGREEMKVHGVEVTSHVARGAMHAIDETTGEVKNLARSVMESTATTANRAGATPEDALLGASQGIIQGAAETKADLGIATLQAIDAAKQVAEQFGLSRGEATAKAVEGALQAAEALGIEAVAKVAEAVPEELLASVSDEEATR